MGETGERDEKERAQVMRSREVWVWNGAEAEIDVKKEEKKIYYYCIDPYAKICFNFL